MSLRRTPDLQRHRTIFETVQSLRAPHPKHDTGWITVVANAGALPEGDPGSESGGITPIYRNNWSGTAAFYLSPDGEVRWRGKINGGDVGTNAWFMPVNFRPVGSPDPVFILPNDAGGYAQVQVASTGWVSVIAISTSLVTTA